MTRETEPPREPESAPQRLRDDKRQAQHGQAGSTPPKEARTDPHRGTGEMGMEGSDPMTPLEGETAGGQEEAPLRRSVAPGF